ncbi:MAG: transcriptional repressor NrdR [Clostridia bacterium]|nr:transcriptional repressor NrdR [Clostridia bacterium]
MKCPKCGYTESKVVDSRPAEEGTSIRRRRECLSCQNRFTTYETVETLPLLVIKKDKTRQTFDKNKLLNGIIEACHKRPIPLEQMENIVNEIELELQNSLTHEVPSSKIGVLVMEKLKKLDDVAYVRFASVYREFKDLDTFMKELEKLKSQKNEQQGVQ